MLVSGFRDMPGERLESLMARAIEDLPRISEQTGEC